ncbi:MAG TPA: isoprenylcysteine carboxylmethyltransferase family protein [Bacteroidota bacterium]|nr:isoprenylcysteine carboxylmethyltransferase family protein [Bacteroidota bacterium]
MDVRQKIFELRGYTPVPFVLAMLIFAQPTFSSIAIGLVIALLGEALRFWGVAIVGTETRTTGPVGATNLITDGPFAYLRNPLYVGNMTIYFGFGIMSNALMPWLAIGALVYFVFQYYMIVSREEEHLRSAFGDEFVRYCANVPRFFPRFTPYRGEHAFHRTPDLKRGFESETRTLQAFGIIFALIVLSAILRH